MRKIRHKIAKYFLLQTWTRDLPQSQTASRLMLHEHCKCCHRSGEFFLGICATCCEHSVVLRNPRFGNPNCWPPNAKEVWPCGHVITHTHTFKNLVRADKQDVYQHISRGRSNLTDKLGQLKNFSNVCEAKKAWSKDEFLLHLPSSKGFCAFLRYFWESRHFCIASRWSSKRWTQSTSEWHP